MSTNAVSAGMRNLVGFQSVRRSILVVALVAGPMLPFVIEYTLLASSARSVEGTVMYEGQELLIPLLAGAITLFVGAFVVSATLAAGIRERALTPDTFGSPRTRFLLRSIGNGVALTVAGGLIACGLGVAMSAIVVGVARSHGSIDFDDFAISPDAILLLLVIASVIGLAGAGIPALVITARRAPKPPPGSVSISVAQLSVACLLVGALLIALAAIGFATANDGSGSTIASALITAGMLAIFSGCVVVVPVVIRRFPLKYRQLQPVRTLVATSMMIGLLGSGALGFIAGMTHQQIDEYDTVGPTNSVQVSLALSDEDGTTTLSPDSARVKAAMNSALGTNAARILAGTPEVNASGKNSIRPRKILTPACRHDHRCNTAWFSNYGGDPGVLVVVGGVPELAAMLGHRPSPRAIEELKSGGVVSLFPGFVSRGTAIFDHIDGRTGHRQDAPITLGAVERPTSIGYYGMIISPSTAARLHVTFAPTAVLADLRSEPTDDQLARLDEALSTIGGRDGELSSLAERGPDTSAWNVGWIIALVAILVSVGSSAVIVAVQRPASSVRRRMVRPTEIARLTLAPIVVGSIFGALLGLIGAIAIYPPAAALFVTAQPLAALVVATLALPAVLAAVASIRRRESPRAPFGNSGNL